MSFMSLAKKIAGRLALFGVLLATLLTSMALYRIFGRPSVFASISSPHGTYKVNLTGHKKRPVFFTNEVRFHVLKSGQPFVTDQYLHSGDAFDLSFESGYPDYRWPAENILQFYREQNFTEGPPDTLIIINKATRAIKYLRVLSTDKFLLFDLQPGTETKLLASPFRGGLHLKGEFVEGKSFENGVAFRIQDGQSGPFTYYIYITDDNLMTEDPHQAN